LPKTNQKSPRQDPARSAGLRRGLEILGLFSDAKPEWGISEVARELGVLKSQIHRAIKTLEDMHYLRRDSKTRRYCLGFKAFEIGTLAGRQTNRMAWARPYLKKLARELDATVSLRLVDASDLLIVDIIEGMDDPSSHLPQGARVPLNYGAGGQVLAAFLSENKVLDIIRKHGLPRYTLKSLTNPADFLAAVRRVKRNGYAISKDETVPGSFSVAAPIVSTGRELIAVLVAARPLKRMTQAGIDKFITVVVETATRISNEQTGHAVLAG
jgi:IclR family KDG regulon transcriptional repressor